MLPFSIHDHIIVGSAQVCCTSFGINFALARVFEPVKEEGKESSLFVDGDLIPCCLYCLYATVSADKETFIRSGCCFQGFQQTCAGSALARSLLFYYFLNLVNANHAPQSNADCIGPAQQHLFIYFF